MRTATLRVSGSGPFARSPVSPVGRRFSERRHLVYVDIEDGLALVVTTVGANAMRHLGVSALRAAVYGHTLRLDVRAALALALLRRALFWNGHQLLVL